MDIFSSINWAIIAPLLIIQLILIAIALLDLFKNPKPKGPKWMWIFIILLGTVPGPIAYFVFGRGDEA